MGFQGQDGPIAEEGPSMTPTATAAADHYLAERVMTASPAELTAMLYDACVGAIKSGIRLQSEGNHVAAGSRLLKAQDIVLELRTTLNPAAGDLALSLDALYTFAWSQLVAATCKRDSEAARAALEVVEPLQLAWRASCLTAKVA
ncbi:MAG: flagellar biosynthesis protein FliS [Frankiales bacterium]|nr:flagellar biosynthesis protein FliS [Frankiales bacterium]